MAAHRYWRVFGAASGDNTGYFGFYEVQFMTAIGGASVATGGTASSTGRVFSGTAAAVFNANLTDGIILNGYDSATDGCSVIYDFGAGNSKDIVEVGIAPRNDSFFAQSPCVGELQWSDTSATGPWTKAFGWSVPAWTFASEFRYFSATAVGVCLDFNTKTASVKVDTSPRTRATFTAVSTAAINTPASGPTYGEFTITTLTGTPAVGLVNSAYNYAVGTLLGADANSLGYRSGGAVVANGVTLATLGTFVQGDRVDVAFDPKNRLIWFRVNGGNWNNNALNDPVAQVGGIDTSSVNFGRALLAAGASITGTVVTGAFNTFVGTPPTGYVSAGTVASTPVKPGVPIVVLPGYTAYQGPLAYRGRDLDNNCLRRFYPAGTITVVSGTTQEVGVAAGSKRVEVYDRVSGELIGTTLSDGSGNWSVPALGRPAVRVVGSDPTTYNSIVYDNVVPV